MKYKLLFLGATFFINWSSSIFISDILLKFMEHQEPYSSEIFFVEMLYFTNIIISVSSFYDYVILNKKIKLTEKSNNLQ